jgi:ribosomal protein S20
MAVILAVLMVSPGLVLLARANQLSVDIERNYYTPGEIVKINGTADPGTSVTVRINSTLGEVYRTIVLAGAGGTYNVTYSIPTNATLGRYLVTASAAGLTSQRSFTVIKTEAQRLAESLLSMVDQCRTRVEDLFGRIEDNGTTVPASAQDDYELGVNASIEAHRLFQEGNYSASIDESVVALQHFKLALLIASSVWHPEDVEKGEHGVGPRVAIDRAYLFLDRINATALRLREEGYDVTQILGNLTLARSHLDNATRLLDSGDTNGAAQELAEARGILGRAMGALHAVVTKFGSMKMDKFLKQTESCIQGMRDKFNGLRNRLTQNETTELNRILKKAESGLTGVRNWLNMRKLDVALDELSDSVEELQEGLEAMDGHEVSTVVMDIQRLEAKIQALNSTSKQLIKKGVNVSELQSELRSAESLLKEALAEIDAGNQDSAKASMNQAQSHIEAADDLIHTSKHVDHSRGRMRGR